MNFTNSVSLTLALLVHAPSVSAVAMFQSADTRTPVEVRQSGAAPAAIPAARGECSLVMYDIQDLLESAMGHSVPAESRVETPPVAGNAGRAEPVAGAPDESDAAQRERAYRAFEQLLRKHLTPKLGEAPEVLQISRQGTLTANLRQDQHRWLEAFLNTQRAFDGLIEIQARMYTLPHGLLGKLGIESSAMLPSDVDRDAFLARIAAEKGVESYSMPNVLVWPNQLANLSVLNQVAYVKEYTVEVVEPGRQEIADPHVAVISEGLSLNLCATPLAGGDFALDLKLQNSRVLRPIRTRKIRLSSTVPTEVEIGLPEVTTVQIVSTVKLRDGASVVLSTPSQAKDEDVTVVLTARRVKLPTAEGEKK